MLKFHFIEITYALHHLAAVGETLVNDRECLLKEEGGEEMAPPLSLFLPYHSTKFVHYSPAGKARGVAG